MKILTTRANGLLARAVLYFRSCEKTGTSASMDHGGSYNLYQIYDACLCFPCSIHLALLLLIQIYIPTNCRKMEYFLALPLNIHESVQGSKNWFAKCDKHYPSRFRQTSLATAVTNFTKPRTSHFFGLCI